MTLFLVQFLSLRFYRPPSTSAFDSRVVVGVGVITVGAFLFFLATDRFRYHLTVAVTTEARAAERLREPIIQFAVNPVDEFGDEEVHGDSDDDSDTDTDTDTDDLTI